MERGDQRFSGSEEFTKSLEPSYGEQERRVVGRMREVAFERSGRESPARQPPGRPPRRVRPQAPHDPHAHHRRKKFEVFSAFYLFLLLVLIAVLSASTDATPFIVFLSFLPTLFTVVIAMIIYEAHANNKNVLWVVPFVLVFAFYWYGSTQGGIVAGIDVGVLTALNVFASFLYLIINYFLLQSSASRREPGVRVVERVVEKEVVPDDLSKFIASIEDKGKALNFVIGRVYNAYHGGTKDLRSKINMKQEWYDQFSQLPEDPGKVDFVALGTLISTIESRLHLLEKRERDIFGGAQLGFKHLVRDPLGNDSILDVLDKNDKDPVKSYVEGALQFCRKVKDFISKRHALGVSNEYVPREGEEKKAAPRSSWTARGGLER
ncbi:hypothetical protein JXA12_05015 [Candidatus Woesearchaeota archaeon]|nr:hypothetical protein [Candidatus Woesearchaeota archaeon]